MRIGIFDSGIGGLSLYKDIAGLIPDAEYFYIADKAFCPYGNKSNDQIIGRCRELAQKLIGYEVDLIVVACNTATAVAIDDLRQRHSIPLVGIEPYIKVIERFQKNEQYFKLVVLLTNLSAQSERFHRLKDRFDPENLITVHPCSNLANLIENHIHLKGTQLFQREIEAELAPLKDQAFTHVILGCTHYPLIQLEITNFLNITCLSPGEAVARRVQDLLLSHGANAKATSTNMGPIPSSPLYFEMTGEDPDIEAKLKIILEGRPYQLTSLANCLKKHKLISQK